MTVSGLRTVTAGSHDNLVPDTPVIVGSLSRNRSGIVELDLSPGGSSEVLSLTGHRAPRTMSAVPSTSGLSLAQRTMAGEASVDSGATAAVGSWVSGVDSAPANEAVPPSSKRTPMSELQVAFVDDEPANCRLGLRLLTKLGVLPQNVTVLTDGMCRRKLRAAQADWGLVLCMIIMSLCLRY